MKKEKYTVANYRFRKNTYENEWENSLGFTFFEDHENPKVIEFYDYEFGYIDEFDKDTKKENYY